MKRASLFAVVLFGLAMPAPAMACSFSWKPGWSPEEIKERTDVRKVRAKYRMEELQGERVEQDGDIWIIDGRFVGRLVTKRGTGWDIWHDAPDDTLTCTFGTYFKPRADAQGTFWISRRKVDGRYQILLWEGEYLPASEDAEQSESDAN